MPLATRGKFKWLQGTTLHSESMIKNKSKSCLQDSGEITAYSWLLRTFWRAKGSEQGELSNSPFLLARGRGKPKEAFRDKEGFVPRCL